MGLLRRVARKIVTLAGAGPADSEVLPTAPAPRPPPVADGPSLATMECGGQELRERLEAGESMTLVDVREPFETTTGIIPGAVQIPLRELAARWEELAEADEIVCYCTSGDRSYDAAMLLRRSGLFNATSLEGGINTWRAIGGTITSAEG